MSEELKFFLFLIERYAEKKDLPTGKVMQLWDEKGITQTIYDCYFEYHQEALENAFMDIDSLIATGKHAW